MNLLYTLLVCLAFVVGQALLGGTRLLFLLPVTVLIGATALFSAVSVRSKRLPPNGLCVGTTLILVGYVFWRGITSPVGYIAWSDLFNIATALGVYLLTACYLVEPGRRLAIVGLLLAMSFLQMFVGAHQFTRPNENFMLVQWPDTILNFARSTSYLGRASGLYICPNHLAGYLEVVGSLALGAALWSRQKPWLRLLFGYGGLACFGGLLLTGSRGGMLSSAAALAILGIGSLLRVRAMAPASFGRVLLLGVAITVVVVGVAGSLLVRSQLLKSRAELTFNLADVRPLLWGAALKQFQTQPLVGTGSGTYLYYGRHFRHPELQNEPVHAHGDYLEFLAEYGVLGAAALGLFLTAHLRGGFRTFRALLANERGGASGIGAMASNAAALNLGALAAVGSYLVHSVFDFNLHIPVNAMLMAFVCGLLAHPGRALPGTGAAPAGEENPGFRGWTVTPLRLALPVLGIALLATAIPRLPGEYWCERARVAIRDGQFLEGIRCAKLGLEVEKQNPVLFYHLGEARMASAQQIRNPAVARPFYAAAVEAYESGRLLFPQDIRLLVRLGLALSMLERKVEAESVITEAVRWDPESGRVRAAYAFVLQRAGRLEEAEGEYRRAAARIGDPEVSAGLQEVQRLRAASASKQGG